MAILEQLGESGQTQAEKLVPGLPFLMARGCEEEKICEDLGLTRKAFHAGLAELYESSQALGPASLALWAIHRLSLPQQGEWHREAKIWIEQAPTLHPTSLWIWRSFLRPECMDCSLESLAHSLQRPLNEIQGYFRDLLVRLECNRTKAAVMCHLAPDALHRLGARVAGTSSQALTPSELKVLEVLVRSGAGNVELARQLGVAAGTVKRHLTNIYAKLGVASRLEAVNRARELGLTA